MEYQYKVIVSNRTIYKEFEVPTDMENVKIGTTTACEFRVNPDAFFGNIELELAKTNGKWELYCLDSVYVSKGDMRKLLSTELTHGDTVSICYESNGNEAFELRFMIDFEAKVPNYNWYVELGNKQEVTIGDSGNCDIVIKNRFGSGNRVSLMRSETGVEIREHESQYGVYVNGKRIQNVYKLNDYNFFSIVDASFYYKENRIYFDCKEIVKTDLGQYVVEENISGFKYPLFNRNTRVKEHIDTEVITILDPPQVIEKPKQNILQSLIPAISMLVLTVVVRGFMSGSTGGYLIFSVCSMGMGIATSVWSFINSQKDYKKDCENRIDTYAKYIEKKREEIACARQEELDILNNTYFDVNKDCKLVEEFSSRLFDRTMDEEDFLKVFLGRGNVKAKKQIEYKKKDTYTANDELCDIPEQIKEEYAYIANAPVVLDLKSVNAVGVIGNKENNYEMFKNMLLDISIRQYYGDVKVFTLVEENSRQFDWIRLLPHLNNAQGKRNIVCDVESKNNIFEQLYVELSNRKEQKKNHKDYYVIFVLDEHGIKNHPISKFIENAADINVVFVFFEEKMENIPLNCGKIVQLQEESKGIVFSSDDKSICSEFIYDKVPDKRAEEIIRRLAPIYCEQISLESSLRKNISLFELIQIFSAEDLDLRKRWESSQIYNSMAAPLGVNAKDEVISLNLHEKAHGPHGLVAGTTGSGKSEILQSYILSAASLFHPYEIGFVIIDFKGGGMVNQFKELPHLIGAITNIDGKEIDRSLKSIKAELLKRQSLFAEAKVNHVDKYIKLFKEGKVSIPLPHLVIIVDEFAELKAEQPEFMKELISAARIGRSLGVHLILATQKPAGQVNEQIWSNSKFKLCLKVQNQEDSKEVLKSPLAAEIREPGRAYLQVGNNEIFELFQSAYSGGPAVVDNDGTQKKYKIYDVDFVGRRRLIYEKKLKERKKNSETELEAIVKYIAKFCEDSNIAKLPNICLPSLADLIVYENQKDISLEKELRIPLGIYDDPDNQYQGVAYSEIGRENTIIVGASQTGKTNLLQLMIRALADNNTPEEVNFYIMDFGSMVLRNFEKLAHVGGVVLASEDEKVKNLFKLLMSESDSRKNRLMQKGVSSYSAYKEAGGTDMPKLYVMVDNFNALKELYMDKYEAEFIKLCRDGASLGITVIITNASSNGIGYRHMSNFSNRICLSCNDSSEYSTVLERCRMEPKNVPGRALIIREKNIYEVQTYLAFSGEKEIDRANAVHSFVEASNQKYEQCENARQIPSIPDVLNRSFFTRNCGGIIEAGMLPLGLDFATIDPVTIDFGEEIELALIGKKKEPVLRTLHMLLRTLQLNSLKEKTEFYIMDNFERSLARYKDNPLTARYCMDGSESELLLQEVKMKLEMKKNMLMQGISDNSLGRIIVVINSRDTMEYISTTKPVITLFNEIVKNYKSFGVFFIYSDVDDAAVAYSGPELLKRIKENRKALVFNNLNNVKIFDISASVARANTKALMPDEAYLMNGAEIMKVKLITEEE